MPAGAGLGFGEDFFQPPKPGPGKNATYECGVESIGEAPRCSFRSQYYLYCIIFLIFDVEAIFLVPFAVALHRLASRSVYCAARFHAAAAGRVGFGHGARDA